MNIVYRCAECQYVTRDKYRARGHENGYRHALITSVAPVVSVPAATVDDNQLTLDLGDTA